jgi:uncharacterized RDD family membrane protein YckC
MGACAPTEFVQPMTNPYAPPQAVVQDVVDPNAGVVLAERGTRLGAVMLDGVIFMVMVYAPLVATAIMSGLAQRSHDESRASAMLAVGGAATLIGLGVWSWLTIKYVRSNGQSIAKKVVGIKVVRTDGTPISVARLFWVRNVLNALISMVPLYGFIDSLCIFGEARRCLHDQIADTIVIKA